MIVAIVNTPSENQPNRPGVVLRPAIHQPPISTIATRYPCLQKSTKRPPSECCCPDYEIVLSNSCSNAHVSSLLKMSRFGYCPHKQASKCCSNRVDICRKGHEPIDFARSAQ